MKKIKMKIIEIEKIEKTPLFKLFLKRIWFKNYMEYFTFFWDDIKKREECARRFKKTYPNFTFKSRDDDEIKH